MCCAKTGKNDVKAAGDKMDEKYEKRPEGGTEKRQAEKNLSVEVKE